MVYYFMLISLKFKQNIYSPSISGIYFVWDYPRF